MRTARSGGRSEPVVEGRDMSVDLDGLGEAGQYTVAFRVISEDGHPIDGTYNFQLTQANPGAASSASGTAPATTTGSSDTAQPADEDSGGFPAWILIAVAVVVIGGARGVLPCSPEHEEVLTEFLCDYRPILVPTGRRWAALVAVAVAVCGGSPADRHSP